MVNYEILRRFVQEKHSGHPFAGWDHILRVHDLCLKLAEGLKVDQDVLRVAAYLHDIAVPVFGPEKHNIRAAEVVGRLLWEIGVPEEKHAAIFDAVKTHTRYASLVAESLEAKILRDADGLDYLGAIGILRNVLRSFKRGSYDGDVSVGGRQLVAELYERVEGTFETGKAKKIAEERIEFIKKFIKRLDEEFAYSK